MFIGRKNELQFLGQKYESAHSELVVLYGRRRVGKTETLREFCRGKEHVFYSCTECTDTQQLKAFSERVLLKKIPASQYISKFIDWEQAFRSIMELPGEPKKLLIIDEFPYMVKNNHSIPSILQNTWDAELKDSNVMIILCGSSMSFIEKEILAEKNPLYGRATGILKMKEMDFYDAAEFFPEYSPLDKIRAYAILGGIPHYLKQFEQSKSLTENIIENILGRGSILYSEVEFLMRQELREITIYNTIIEAIALGNTKLNDIYTKTQIEKSKLIVYIKNLIGLGIIGRQFPVSENMKARVNVQRGLYKISDYFFRFWYAFLFPNMSELETGDARGVYQYSIEPRLEEFVAMPFEEICQQYMRKKNQLDQLPFHFSQIGRWWNKTEEIDIFATDLDRNCYILGECKFRNRPVSSSDYRRLASKFKAQNPDSVLYYYLFSKSGFQPDLTNHADDITLVSLEEIADLCKTGQYPGLMT